MVHLGLSTVDDSGRVTHAGVGVIVKFSEAPHCRSPVFRTNPLTNSRVQKTDEHAHDSFIHISR